MVSSFEPISITARRRRQAVEADNKVAQLVDVIMVEVEVVVTVTVDVKVVGETRNRSTPLRRAGEGMTKPTKANRRQTDDR